MKRSIAAIRVIPAAAAFGRPKTLRLEDFTNQVAAGAFSEAPVTVKRNGFAIVCENWGDGVRYFTKRGFGVTGTDDDDQGGPLGKTLQMIGAHLEKMDMFDPRRVDSDGEIASHPEEELGAARECTRVHVEFCVRLKSDPAGKDDLCALMHGKWAANPSAYEVQVLAFDIEVDEDDNGENLPFWDRYAMMCDAFPPENVVQALKGTDEILHALATAEGIVAYDRCSVPWKVKAPHPLPMKIVAVRRTVQGFMGYDTALVGVPEGPSERQYRVLCEINMAEMFTTGPERKGKCFLDASLFEPHKKTGKTAYKGPSRVAQMVCKLTDAVFQTHRTTERIIGPTRAVMDDISRCLRIDDGRSFGFAAGDEFLDPPRRRGREPERGLAPQDRRPPPPGHVGPGRGGLRRRRVPQAAGAPVHPGRRRARRRRGPLPEAAGALPPRGRAGRVRPAARCVRGGQRLID